MPTSIKLPYPEDGSHFDCPVCQTSYKMYTSYVRHINQKHKDQVVFSFQCDSCGQEYSTKRSVSIHYAKTHTDREADKENNPGNRPSSAPTPSSDQPWRCKYCELSLTNKRSLGQHIRNQHAAAASHDRAQEAATATRREWTPQEHALFMDALAELGPASNVAIARHIGTKTCKQVGVHKRIFLRDHSDWLQHHPPPPLPSVGDTAWTSKKRPSRAKSRKRRITSLSSDGTGVESDRPSDSDEDRPGTEDSVETEQQEVVSLCPPPSVCPLSHSDSPLPSQSQSQSHIPVSPSALSDHSSIASTITSPVLSPPSTPTPPSPPPLSSPIPPLPPPPVTIPSSPHSHPQSPSPLTMPQSLPGTTPPNDPASTPSQTSEGRPSDKERREELRRKRTEIMERFMASYGGLLERELCDDEWEQFSEAVVALQTELALSKGERRRAVTNPSTHWRRRQRRRVTDDGQRDDGGTQSSRPDEEEETTADSSQSGSQVPQSGRERGVPSHSRGRNRAQQARRIQAEYRANKKRCMRRLLGEQSVPCKIEVERLERHFSTECQPLGEEVPDWLGSPHEQGERHELTYTTTPEEVTIQLRRLPWNSSPGSDGVGYEVWKSVDSSAQLLSAVYNTCLLSQRIPTQWKGSTTILIHKKGDLDEPRNWRPISLQPTVYKILAAVLARRLASWATSNGRLSPCQKGFLPNEGCAEHCFLLESALADAKRRRRNIRLAWLDIRNAFGSVPHQLMWFMMRHAGVPEGFIGICNEIYDGSYQRVKSEGGSTGEIPLAVGIKQGCPLSPLLFNFALEGLLMKLYSSGRGYTLENGSCIGCLAYADDLCVLGVEKEDVQNALDLTQRFAEWARISFNIAKCGVLSVINNSRRGRYVEPFSPMLGDHPLPALQWEDSYRYLGVETGRVRDGTRPALREKVFSKCKQILQSKLADWQKVDAINCFALSHLTYHLNSSLLDRTWVKKLDSDVRKEVKKALGFPQRTTSSFFHLPTSMGGLGLLSVEDLRESATVTRLLKVLNSRDKLVSDVAWCQLRATIKKRDPSAPETMAGTLDFLNKPPERNEYNKGDVRSLFSQVRKSLSYLSCSLVAQEGRVTLAREDNQVQPGKWPALQRVLKSVRAERRKELLLECKDQGRSFHLVSQDPASNSWIATGNYLGFREMKFALKARLNLLPCRVVAKRAGRNIPDTKCRRCHSQPETLAHLLNACTPSVGLMRARHNAVLERLVKAIPTSDSRRKYIEQSWTSADLRPDLVLVDDVEKKAVVVDVTIPFEGSEDAFAKARGEKEQKYQQLTDHLRDQHGSAEYHSLVVGSMGSWDPNNTKTLRALGVRKNYTPLFSKLCCIDAIKHSSTIWKAKD